MVTVRTAAPTFTRGDGTGRRPRKVQVDTFNWLREQWDEAPIKAGGLPVGSGKSYVARAVQLSTEGALVTPSNILIDQYAGVYKTANFLKGKTHYECSTGGMSCATWTGELQQKACEDCPYTKSRLAAAAGAPTIFNPMSLTFLIRQFKNRFPTIVVDEAHQLPGMLSMLTSRRLRKADYPFTDNCTNERELHVWLTKQAARLRGLMAAYRRVGDAKKIAECAEDAESLELLAEGLAREPHNFAVWIEQGEWRGRREQFLNIKPIRVPEFVSRNVLASDNIILLSGSLFPHDVRDLCGDERVAWYDAPSPIPKEQRLIRYRPIGKQGTVNKDMDPAALWKWCEARLKEFPNRNTIIHVSYAWSKRLEKIVPDWVHRNTAETKDKVLSVFKARGGVWLAAGCAEGLDLADDQCRLNLIPMLQRPNLGDPVVQKRRAFEDGDQWYDLETLKVTIQQAGRSTRHEKDESIIVVGDPGFPGLFSRRKNLLPKSFTESVDWTK